MNGCKKIANKTTNAKTIKKRAFWEKNHQHRFRFILFAFGDIKLKATYGNVFGIHSLTKSMKIYNMSFIQNDKIFIFGAILCKCKACATVVDCCLQLVFCSITESALSVLLANWSIVFSNFDQFYSFLCLYFYFLSIIAQQFSKHNTFTTIYLPTKRIIYDFQSF